MQTTLIIKGEDVRLWTMMKALASLGVFDIKYGGVYITFDGEGKVSNVKVEKNYKIAEIPLN